MDRKPAASPIKEASAENASGNQASEAYWPAKPAVVACCPKAVAAITIKAGCMDAPYPNGAEPEPSKEEIAFWDRVAEEADRIADWAVQGLSITGRAQRFERSAKA